MEIGIVGLPNVGKSTLFNALTSGHAASSNYPFTTIDPNVGVVSVPDPKLKRLAEIFRSEKTVPATIRFVDIAGLVKGASQGEGLGNQFLSHIREVDAIVHLVRLFRDANVVHIQGEADSQRDMEIIETELTLSDLASVERQIEKAEGPAKSGDKTYQEKLELLRQIQKGLAQGTPARRLGISKEKLESLSLLTAKPVFYVGNVSETSAEDSSSLKNYAEKEGAPHLVLSGKLEAEIAQLPPEERGDFLKEMNLQETGLDKLIHTAYRWLKLLTFYTAGPKEAHAWTISQGTKAPQAAGKIHSDMERGFIKAEVYRFEDIDRLASEAALREKGLIRTEGKEYPVQDGDVLFFRFQAR